MGYYLIGVRIYSFIHSCRFAALLTVRTATSGVVRLEKRVVLLTTPPAGPLPSLKYFHPISCYHITRLTCQGYSIIYGAPSGPARMSFKHSTNTFAMKLWPLVTKLRPSAIKLWSHKTKVADHLKRSVMWAARRCSSSSSMTPSKMALWITLSAGCAPAPCCHESPRNRCQC